MLFILQSTANAANQKKAALEAYNTFLTKEIEWYPETWKGSKKVIVESFALIYLDNNSVPELYVYGGPKTYHIEGQYRMFTFYKGKIEPLGEPTNDLCLKCYKKTGFFVAGDAWFGNEPEHYYYYPGKLKTIELICTKVYYYGKFQNYGGISKKEFNRLVKKYSKGKKATKVKWYKNTAENREMYLK